MLDGDSNVIDLQDSQVIALQALQKCYQDSAEDARSDVVVSAFHGVLTSLLRYELAGDSNTCGEPLVHCVALSQLKYDGSFKNPRDGVTKMMAAIEFLARCWLTHQIQQEREVHGGCFRYVVQMLWDNVCLIWCQGVRKATALYDSGTEYANDCDLAHTGTAPDCG